MAAHVTFCSVRNKKKIEVMDFKNLERGTDITGNLYDFCLRSSIATKCPFSKIKEKLAYFYGILPLAGWRRMLEAT